MRDGLNMVRPKSGLLTTSTRELVTVCKGEYLRGIGYQVDLDQSYNLYTNFRITTKLSLFNHSLIPFSFLFPTYSLACN